MTTIHGLIELSKRNWPSSLDFLKPVLGQAALLLGYEYKISYSKLISGWIRGFYGDKHIYYDFDRYGYEAYVSDFAREKKTGLINGEYGLLLGDKVIFSHILSGLGVSTPRIYAENVRGTTIYYDGYKDTLAELVAQHGPLIVKPRFGSGGIGVRLVAPDDLSQQLNEGEFVCERVSQHEYAAQMFSESTNTIRIVTGLDAPSGEPFIIFAVHKIGTSRSAPVDNFGSGGLVACIDVESGLLGPAATMPTSNMLHWHEKHPESGQPIAGIQVPNWTRLCSEVLRLAKLLSATPYIGWDIVVTEEGYCVLEGNTRTDVHGYQMHKPLLLDERTRKFYKSHKAA